MRKNTLLLISSLLLTAIAYAQNPLVKLWDKRFGGTGFDAFTKFQQTKDGGFIIGGLSNSSIGGDKTQDTIGYYDYWVVKLDSLGNKEWDKDFGGTNYDALYSLVQTSDGGYLLGGYSFSEIGGDKTQANWDSTCLTVDYWIVKIDSLGNKQWDKTFGGILHDFFFALFETSDMGFVLGGYSRSPVSGDKTQSSWANSYDYWIIKIDSLGNKQWDKVFGGIHDEELTSLIQTKDGGYILGGSSRSGISGDKTAPNWDTICNCTPDYWVVKIDSVGNKLWDKVFGGTGSDYLISLQQTVDDGYISIGGSHSGISGNKTQPPWGQGDFWIVKMDQLGNKQWDKVIGGLSHEGLHYVHIIETVDSGYLVSGASYSTISGDKTENNLGYIQTWIIKTDSLGFKQWDKTIQTPGQDIDGYAIQTKDGCFVITSTSYGGIGGYRSEPNRDTTESTSDYWLIKFCDSTLTTSTGNINHASGFNVYPNPFDKELNVQSLKFKVEQGCAVKVYDVFGKEMYSNTHTTLNFKLQTLNWPNGIYLLEVITDKERLVRKVVKQ